MPKPARAQAAMAEALKEQEQVIKSLNAQYSALQIKYGALQDKCIALGNQILQGQQPEMAEPKQQPLPAPDGRARIIPFPKPLAPANP